MQSEKKPLPKYQSVKKEEYEEDPAGSVRNVMSARTDWFASAMSGRADALEISRAYSDAIDDAVRNLFEISVSDRGCGCAVFALGGYGRREMGLATDVDLLFLVEDEDEKGRRGVTDGILYPFWDAGVEVGGATRRLADCESVMHGDARALTAMMDARLIAGSPELLDELRKLIAKYFASKSRRARFIDDKIAEHDARLERYGGSIYLLQPNIKEGEGGLRELHTLRWIASAAREGSDYDEAIKSFVPEEESRCCLVRAHRYLWAARHALHLFDSRTNDKLAEQAQHEVANTLGYTSTAEGTAGENFMSDYYMHAETMHLICERGIEMVRREQRPPTILKSLLSRSPVPGGIARTEYGTFTIKNREDCVDALTELNLFATARRTGTPIDPITKGWLGTASSCDIADIGSLEATRSLRDIFSSFKNLERTLLDMHECGALVRWFPEMVPMFHLVQHDGFHYYTAGIHSIRALGEIEALGKRSAKRDHPILRQAYSRVRRQHVLALATLFHDVGKGRGGDHSEKGAALAGAIARRIGYDEVDVNDIEFLIRSHILMSTLAFRRDIRDPELIERFAQTLRNPEVLAMLYLLTYGDIRAIGPNIWSGWKGSLLGELYTKTYDFMIEGRGSPERRSREGERIVASVRKQLGSDVEANYIKGYLDKLPERYVHSVAPDAIAAHILLSRDVESKGVSTFVREVPERACVEFSIVTKDSPGLFARIAGVLAANGANIIDSQIYTSSDGTAIDVIWVTDANHGMLTDPNVWSRIRRDIADAAPEGADIASILGGRLKRGVLGRRAVRRPTEVSVENDVSALHTVVEIKADDRRGLLYTIARTFHELGLGIDLARITTHVDRVIDVFYIRDSDGQKVSSKERLDLMKERLLKALE